MNENKIYVVASGSKHLVLAASEDEATERVTAHTNLPARVVASGTMFDTFVSFGDVNFVGLTLPKAASRGHDLDAAIRASCESRETVTVPWAPEVVYELARIAVWSEPEDGHTLYHGQEDGGPMPGGETFWLHWYIRVPTEIVS